ncbi:MAG: hypothetical protein PWR30_47 [Candidatus Woesearchaeota archaeon]|nr:hypothetical protein [Candidatus Woesearchaeota archaeon]
MKNIVLLIVLFIVTIMLSSCTENYNEIVENQSNKTVDEENGMNEDLVRQGYEDRVRINGFSVSECNAGKEKTPTIAIQSIDGESLGDVASIPFVVCIGAGEKRTGGYRLELKEISANNELKELYIDLFLRTPSKDEMVTQAFTYPSIGVGIFEPLEEGKWNVYVSINDKLIKKEAEISPLQSLQ